MEAFDRALSIVELNNNLEDRNTAINELATHEDKATFGLYIADIPDWIV